jgi:Tol biopolymer transport system component
VTNKTVERLTQNSRFEGWPNYLPGTENFIFSRENNDDAAINLYRFDATSKTQQR